VLSGTPRHAAPTGTPAQQRAVEVRSAAASGARTAARGWGAQHLLRSAVSVNLLQSVQSHRRGRHKLSLNPRARSKPKESVHTLYVWHGNGVHARTSLCT
jgi:hypothetical protein